MIWDSEWVDGTRHTVKKKKKTFLWDVITVVRWHRRPSLTNIHCSKCFTCLPRTVCGARAVPQWDVVSCSPAAYECVTHTSFLSHRSQIRLETDISPMALCLVLDKQKTLNIKSADIFAALMEGLGRRNRVLDSSRSPHRPPAGPSTGPWWAVALIDHL